jgi:hypothetical protein
MACLGVVAASLLWWPLFPVVKTHGPLARVLALTISGVITIAGVAVGTALVTSLFLFWRSWLEQRSEPFHRFQVAFDALCRMVATGFLLLALSTILFSAISTGSIRLPSYTQHFASLADNPLVFLATFALWFIFWLAFGVYYFERLRKNTD